MNCPVCLEYMADENLFDVEINICKYCGGLWLDAGELARYVSSGNIPEKLLESEPQDMAMRKVNEGERICPRCGGRLKVMVHQGINIDFCEQCHGTWFDREELRIILTRYYTDLRDKNKPKPGFLHLKSPRLITSDAAAGEGETGGQKEKDSHGSTTGALLLEQELLGDLTGEDVVKALPKELLDKMSVKKGIFRSLRPRPIEGPPTAEKPPDGETGQHGHYIDIEDLENAYEEEVFMSRHLERKSVNVDYDAKADAGSVMFGALSEFFTGIFSRFSSDKDKGKGKDKGDF